MRYKLYSMLTAIFTSATFLNLLAERGGRGGPVGGSGPRGIGSAMNYWGKCRGFAGSPSGTANILILLLLITIVVFLGILVFRKK